MNNSELDSMVKSITGIEYDREKSYYKEIRAQQLAKRFDEIEKEIQMLENLKASEKKPLFNDFRLKVLREEQQLLTDYAVTDFKMKYINANREKELSDLYDKIQNLETKYQKQIERSENARKERSKYSSYKKSVKISNKIIELNAKIGLLKSKQLMSSINNYNNMNESLKFKATTNVIDNMVKETAITVRDKAKDVYVRVSKSEIVSRLKGLIGKMKEAPSVITPQAPQENVSIQI